MPTGYTCKVQDGTLTEFRDFALECARAFGALIEMRDQPAGVPIPDEFKADVSYYDQLIATGRAQLDALTGIKLAECDLRAAADHEQAMKGWHERKAERDRQRVRYASMIEKVEAWIPPTPEHYELKDFMLEQLRSSLKFDCVGYDTPPEPQTGAAWLGDQVRRHERSISYGTEQRAKEIERVDGRNEWVRRLRESLSGQ